MLLPIKTHRQVLALALLTLWLPLCVSAEAQYRAQVLDTAGFTVRIEVQCEEGEVTCDKVTYRSESKRTNKKLVLLGRTAHRLCEDKLTPCRFLGYVFKAGKYTYFVSEAGELLVQHGDKVIVQEVGQWQ